jgi:hypothetical protein
LTGSITSLARSLSQSLTLDSRGAAAKGRYMDTLQIKDLLHSQRTCTGHRSMVDFEAEARAGIVDITGLRAPTRAPWVPCCCAAAKAKIIKAHGDGRSQ